MKIPKERIAVGVLLLSATVGLSGCTLLKDREHRMYTAYGVAAPVQNALHRAAEALGVTPEPTNPAGSDDVQSEG